jgi:hypothetical protein
VKRQERVGRERERERERRENFTITTMPKNATRNPTTEFQVRIKTKQTINNAPNASPVTKLARDFFLHQAINPPIIMRMP